jgi:hypothetical protein
MIYLTLTALSILCVIMFCTIFFLLVKVRENVVLVEAYQSESENYMQKYDSLCSQLQSNGFEIRTNYRTACFIQLIKSEVDQC